MFQILSHVTETQSLALSLTCPACMLVASTAPVYKCEEGHLVCHACNNKLINCRTCGIRLTSTRHSEAEELGATLVTMSGGEVENSVPPYRGDILVNVTGVEKIGKGPMTAYVFRIESQIGSTHFPFGLQEFLVFRKLSEFKALHKKLEEKYSKSGVLVPPIPRMTSLNIFYSVGAAIHTKLQDNVGKNDSY